MESQVAAWRSRMKPILRDVRDGVLLVEYGDATDDEANRAAVRLGRRLRGEGTAPILDAVPGARTLLVVFDPGRLDREALARRVERASSEPEPAPDPPRLLRIPVVYDGEDLAEIARAAGLSPDEAVRRHAGGSYRVAFVGFAPGFGYLAGLPRELARPRLSTPRPRVPAGSVAIGGIWTGVYPAASPGGWRLIGRTTTRFFDPRARPPALLEPGDRVAFEPVAAERLVAPLPPLPPAEPRVAGRPFARVVAPGLFTTIQGAPRYGLGSSGVPPGGAIDPASLDLANALVGNPPATPALEVALDGPELELLGEAILAVTGGDARVDRNGEPVAGRAFRVAAGDAVRIGRITRGARVYLAVRGGVAGETGRRLAAGEVLAALDSPAVERHPTLPPLLPEDELVLRVVRGPEASHFRSGQFERFLASAWHVTPECDRRGLRLSGEPLAQEGPAEIAPSGTVPGSIQVPGSGLPIVLGPDGPVTGGYPRIATVVGADVACLGQAGPGSRLRFAEVSLAGALEARGGSTISLP